MRTLICPILLLLAACGGSATAGVLATRADSAGIKIVTNSAPAWPKGEGWQIQPEPILEISAREDDDPHYDLFSVRGARLLPTGEILVLVAGHRELRIYGADGNWVRTIGRAGDGPGEMRSPGGVFISGDSIFVIDNQLSRVTAVSSEGDPQGVWAFPTLETIGRIQPGQRLDDGRWIGWGGIRFANGEMPATGLSRQPVTYWLFPAHLPPVADTILTTPGTEQHLNIATGAGGEIVSVSVYMPPLARSAPMAADQDRFIWGDNAHREVRVHDLRGTLTTILRWEAPTIPVDEPLVASMKEAALARIGDNERARDRIATLYAIPSPAPEVPYFSGIHLDPDGAIWVREYQLTTSDSVRFRVFQRDGQFLGSLALPARTTVHEIGRDRMLTVWQDEDDLEHVRVYRIVK